ncbi:MAG: hypothetical protein KC615_14180, partial [Anaerolineae bacterium]|nr:hypothetical protein [Anaerolineae bacterium]
MPLKPLKLLTDQPIHENQDGRGDGLGFTKYAETLAGAALGTEGPFTIGIFGDWGTGKTSLMRMIEKQLIPEEDVLTVWFEAWRYGREDHPIIPLVSTIIQAIKDQTDNEANNGPFSKVLNALRGVVYGISLKTTVKTTVLDVEANISPKNMIDREGELNKVQEEAADKFAGESLYYNAYAALDQLRQENVQGKIVVFIDDLDRCLPDVAVQLLESIKLVLSQAGFIFVLGMSRPVIDGYLNKRYQQDFGLTDFIGRDYLDKIIQLAFYIPPHRKRIEVFAQGVLDALNEEDRLPLIDILPIVGVACGYNPRITIRFVNNLLVDKSIRRDIPIGYFAITRSLQQYWFGAFAPLTGHDSNRLCETVRNWLKSEIPSFQDENTAEAQLAVKLSSNPDMVELLSTEQGNNWLEDHDQRQATIQFLTLERTESHLYDDLLVDFKYLEARLIFIVDEISLIDQKLAEQINN